MIRLHLDLAPDRRYLYTEALAGLRQVEIVDAAAADALVTGDLVAACEAEGAVLLDRPARNSLPDLAALTSSRLMPAHEWRFLPNIHAVRECHASGQLGEPGLLRVHHWLSGTQAVRPVAFAQLDLAHWFFAAPPETTHFLTRTNYVQVHLGYPGGGMALLDLATRRPGPGNYYTMHLIGSEGAAYADDHHNAHLLFDQHGPRALVPGPNHLLGVRNMLREFLAGLEEDRPWSVLLHDTVNALTTLKEGTDA